MEKRLTPMMELIAEFKRFSMKFTQEEIVSIIEKYVPKERREIEQACIEIDKHNTAVGNDVVNYYRRKQNNILVHNAEIGKKYYESTFKTE